MELLFFECKRCKLTGLMTYGNKKRRCPHCKGKGYIPTKLGAHIIRFYQIFLSNSGEVPKLEN